MNNPVLDMKEIESEYGKITAHAGQAALGAAALRVSGPDRARWLHKLITADVEHLKQGEGVYSALLEAKGHFIADFVVLGFAESFLLVVDSAARDMLLRALKHYIIREKVLVDDESGRWGLLALVGRESDAVVDSVLHAVAPASPFHWSPATFDSSQVVLVRSARARMPSTDLLLPIEKVEALSRTLGAPQMSAQLVELLRIEAGRPRWGVDFDATTLALEIPEVMSIRVDQGCYVGQEVVARLVHRGHVNRQLVGLRLEGVTVPEPGTAINSGDSPVGSITSAISSPRLGVIALGYVRREAAAPGTALRVRESGPAHVSALPFEESISENV